MKKILLTLLILFLFLSAFIVILGQKDNIVAQNKTQEQQVLTGEKDIAEEVDKAAQAAEQQINTFADQFGRIMDVIEKHIKNIMPKLQEIKQTIEERVKKFQGQTQQEKGGQ